MDITKSREDFEAEFRKQHAGQPHIEMLLEMYNHGTDEEPEIDYYSLDARDAWKWWQASRESIEKKGPPKIENHMSQPIAVLDISSRTKNAILNGGISTIGDLLRIGHLGVLKVPGIGRGCEAEIKSALVYLSIEWKPWGESE